MSAFYDLWERMQLQESVKDYMGELYDILQKFPNDVYVHFTEGVAHKQDFTYMGTTGRKLVHQPKIGIRPKVYHQDPLGIYAFPKSYILSGDIDKNPSFARMRYIYIIQLKPGAKIVNLKTLTDQEASRLTTQMGIQDKWDEIKRSLPGSTPGRMFWGALRMLYSYGKNVLLNKYLMKANIDAILDEDGYIHNNEKHQILILNPKSYEVLHLMENPMFGYRAHGKLAYKIINIIASEIFDQFKITSRSSGGSRETLYANGKIKNKPITIYLEYHKEHHDFWATVGIGSRYIENSIESMKIIVPLNQTFDVEKEAKLIGQVFKKQIQVKGMRTSKKTYVANFANTLAKLMGYTKMPNLDEESATLTRYYKKGKFRLNVYYGGGEYTLHVLIETKGMYSAKMDGTVKVPASLLEEKPEAIAEKYLNDALDALEKRIYKLYNPDYRAHSGMYAYDYSEKGKQLLNFLEFIRNKFAITVS